MRIDTSHLIGEAYGAIEGQGWSSFLAAFASATGLPFPAIISGNVARGTLSGVCLEADVTPYLEHYYTIDPYMPFATHLREGRVYAGPALIDPGEYCRGEFYNDFVSAGGAGQGLMVKLEGRPTERMSYFVGLPRHGGTLTDEQVEVAQIVLPHLGRALKLAHRLRLELLSGSRVAECAAKCGRAVLLVRADRRVEFMNASAAELIENQAGVAIRKGKLMLADPAEDATLSGRLIACSAGPRASEVGGVIQLGGPLPLTELEVSPVPSEREFWGGVAECALVTLRAGGSASDPFEERARRHGLARSERELLRLLVGGYSLKEAAAQRRLSYESARTYLKRISAKTGTSGQRKLLRLFV